MKITYKVRCRISSSSYIVAKTDPRSSRTVSLRQLSLLLIFVLILTTIGVTLTSNLGAYMITVE